MNVLNLKITWNILSVIFVSLVLASCGGAVDKYSSTSSTPTAAPITKPQPPYVPPTTSIAAVVAACVAEPMRDTVYYYCDCGTGAEASCVAGNDSNTGTSANTPRRTLANAVSKFSTLGINDTVALCKGGAFDSTGGLNIGSNRCGAGVACNDLREYTPTTFTGTAKPIINNAAGNATLFNFDGNGGIRLLNLKLKGVISSSGNGNHGFFFYQGAHDVTMCNLDMDTFDIAVYNESSAGNTKNIILTGSHITNTSSIGYLGSGDNTEVSYNAWDGNGSSNVFDHTLYFASSTDITNIQVIGNYIHGQYGPTCKGAVMEGHMAVDGLLVKDNVINIDPSANTGGCWGIEFANTTSGTFPEHYRNTIYSSNTIINGGNTGLTVTSCPGCIIENNLIQIETPVGGIGIGVATAPVRTGIADDLNTANIIRNNTIWYGPNANTRGTGIQVGVEGTGHIIANNTVTYSATATGSNGASIVINTRLLCHPMHLLTIIIVNLLPPIIGKRHVAALLLGKQLHLHMVLTQPRSQATLCLRQPEPTSSQPRVRHSLVSVVQLTDLSLTFTVRRALTPRPLVPLSRDEWSFSHRNIHLCWGKSASVF